MIFGVIYVERSKHNQWAIPKYRVFDFE